MTLLRCWFAKQLRLRNDAQDRPLRSARMRERLSAHDRGMPVAITSRRNVRSSECYGDTDHAPNRTHNRMGKLSGEAFKMKKPRRPRPILFVRVDNHMVPLPRFQRLFDEMYAVNEEYPLMPLEERSRASHNHYFAALHEGYLNLAEEYAQEFDSEEHLRHWCLCKAGFCTKDRWVMNTAEDARNLRDALKSQNRSTIIAVNGNVATVYTPMSQSMPAMKKQEFEDSKKAVLELVASMARTTPAELKKNAGRSA